MLKSGLSMNKPAHRWVLLVITNLPLCRVSSAEDVHTVSSTLRDREVFVMGTVLDDPTGTFVQLLKPPLQEGHVGTKLGSHFKLTFWLSPPW